MAALAALIAGCGTDSGIEGSSTADVQTVPAADGPPQGKLTISQWPLYVDPGKDGTRRRVRGQDRRGREMDRGHQRQREFFGKLQPLLAKGESGGRDMLTVSDWLAHQMYDLGYLQKLDYSQLPNVTKNLIPALRHPSADENREFTVPWQSRHDGPDREHRPRARRQLDLRPLRPQVRRQGRHAHRASRHRADDAEVHGHRSRRAPPPTSGCRPSTRSRRRPTRARSAASPATTTSATSPPETSPSCWAGPATRCSSKPTTRTSSS